MDEDAFDDDDDDSLGTHNAAHSASHGMAISNSTVVKIAIEYSRQDMERKTKKRPMDKKNNISAPLV